MMKRFDEERMMRACLSVTKLEDRLTPVTLPDGFTFSFVAGDLNSPTAMAVAPDGRVLITEQPGTVRILDADGVLLDDPALTLTVDSAIEKGLVGITLDPDFESNGFVYLYYTVPESSSEPTHNRISRFMMNGNTLDPESEFVLADLDEAFNGNHMGGALRFGIDGKLYVATGDDLRNTSQSVTNHFGKILRFNPDGSIPDDNPTSIDGIAANPEGIYRSIYAAGFRNPFTFDVNSITGQILVNDVGQNTVEEVNLLEAGRNYGWASTEGPFDQNQFPDFTQPVISYTHGPGNDQGFAVTGGNFYTPDNPAFPEEYFGDYFYADFINGWIRTYDTTTLTNTLFATGLEELYILGMEEARDGSLFVLSYNSLQTSTGSLYRIDYSDLPSIESHPADVKASVGNNATFTVRANSTLPLTYQWQRNGEDIPNATETSYTVEDVTLLDDGDLFRVVVSNANESVTSLSAELSVVDNLDPIPVILTPKINTTFEYGQTFEFSGIAVDYEDGQLPDSALSWRVDYITGDAPPRPFVPETKGSSSGPVTLPTTSPYTRTDVRYRFVFTATDSADNKVTVTRDILPITGEATIASDLPGAQLTVDGAAQSSGYTFDGVVGLERTITASPNVIFEGETYPFLGWSDGVNDLTRTISVAQEGITFLATYIPTPAEPLQPSIVIGNEQSAIVRIVDASLGTTLSLLDLQNQVLENGQQWNQTRVAQGDLNGDGIPEIIVGSGPGIAPFVQIYDGETRELIRSFQAFESNFTGGVYVAAGDLDGDGLAEVIVTPDQGGGPRVRIYRNGNPQSVFADFFGIDDVDFRGGARPSVGDINGDGRWDLVVAAGMAGGPRVAAYDGRTISTNLPVRLFNDFFAFEQTLRNGAYIAVGDFDGDGKADIAAGGGPGGGPRVTIFSGASLLESDSLVPLANFFAGNESNRNGIRLGITDTDGDGRSDLVVGAPPGVSGRVSVYRSGDLLSGNTADPFLIFNAFDEDFTGGVFVG